MRAYVPIASLRAYAAEQKTCTGLSHVITRAALHHGPEAAGNILGESWTLVSGTPTADRLLLWLLAHVPDAAALGAAFMNDSERGAFLQASGEPSLTVCRYSALRKSTGWFRSAEAARPSWTFPKRPFALARLTVTPADIFAVKMVRRHPEFVLQPGRVRYPSHEYLTPQNFN